MLQVAVVGIGYWGKNLVRVFSDVAKVIKCVHTGNVENRKWIRDNFPSVELTTDYRDVLDDERIDTVVIATPIETHFDLTRQAILSGRDVFVEKPLAETTSETEELKCIADQVGVELFVGYIFCHHPTIRPLIKKAREDPLNWGKFTWNKLGDFNRDIGLDLVTHPISVALKLFDPDPKITEVINETAVTGETDRTYIELEFEDHRKFEIEISRISKSSNKSLQTVFDSGELYHWIGEELFRFQNDTKKFETCREYGQEPLKTECDNFIKSVNGNADPRTDGEFGHRVNSVLEKVKDNLTA